MEPLQFRPGQLIEFSSGEYSDFGTIGLMVSLKECNIPALAEEYRTSYVAEDEWDEADFQGFMGWLVAQQHMAPVVHSTVHLGSYGRWEI